MSRFVLFLSAFVALGLSGCSGCSNEHYACDATGCFTCDGIGCRREDPPPRAPCEGDYQCATGERCTTEGCIPECAVTADCPKGTICTNGLCLSPTEPTPPDETATCVRDTDCPSPPAAICIDGICERDPNDCGAASCACSENADCGRGFVCVGGQCLDESGTCQFNGQCGAGRVCVDGQCFAACGGALTCAAGFTCVDGSCQPVDPPTGQCSGTMPCATGLVCVDSSCVPGCMADGDCAAGFYCLSGVCTVDTRPKPFCTDDSGCAAGRRCLDGVCRTPCDTDVQCQMVSGTLPFCRHSVCVTSNEANSDCVTTVDCSGGATCVDGVCN